MYYITNKTKDGINMFLTDRNKTNQVWTSSISEAMEFESYNDAELAVGRFRYAPPEIVDVCTARDLEIENINL